MTPAELEAIRERCQAASPGPWEQGNRYYVAGVLSRRTGDCVYCLELPLIWEGRQDINGTTMLAHVHCRYWAPAESLTSVVAYDVGHGYVMQVAGGWAGSDSALSHADAAFVAHAKEDVPNLLAEVERLRALVGEA